ncbi:hypothetical protein L8P39_08110 [Enterobacter cloacae]|uniref:hypothetical protein n=1 Tax=Enterobacter cloacae TaxID=550 RepID=UPI00200506D7|nr:hypothetical protein [Enterobacter cloacae]MCK7102489.1 hypothetical protein [Enterobacter cloacae]
MKLFEMEGFLRGKCIPRDLIVNETNAEYLVRKLAEADARCAALAAENALLKKSEPAPFSKLMMEALDVYQAGADEVPELAMLSAYKKLRDGLKTPATDAFLAEVRSQGVEMLREHPAIKLCSLTHVCDEFAAQIRKGVQS